MALLGAVVGSVVALREAARRPELAARAPVDTWPKLVADYQAWFGEPSHLDVGYSSVDADILRKQIEQAKQMGISAFAVNWYGDRNAFIDRSYALMQKLAAEAGFQVALLYDETQDENGNASADTLRALEKAYREYIGPSAVGREAYLTYQGRPVIFIFPKHGKADWRRVREYVNTWAVPPLLIYKDEHPQCPDCFDGYYAWVHPSRQWAPDGSDWGSEYLGRFYKRMISKYPAKIAVGAAWPGFDDSRASWGLNRKMDPRCGRTLEDTLRLARRYFDGQRPLPFLMIATWNDYEEGTAIERGVPTCLDTGSSE